MKSVGELIAAFEGNQKTASSGPLPEVKKFCIECWLMKYYSILESIWVKQDIYKWV